jgi:hypothetical protein
MGCEEEVAAATTVEAKLELIARELDRMHLKLVYKTLAPGRIGAARTQPATGVKPLGERHLESTDVRKVFHHWCTVMGKRPNTRMTPERRQKIQQRLKSGYTVEYLCRAIDGCASSDFHMNRGRDATGKRFNDLTLIFRNDTKTEEFHDMAGLTGEEKRGAFL